VLFKISFWHKKVFRENMKVFSIICLALCSLSALDGKEADAIFFGGDVITVNDLQPEAEAVAILDGKIVFVGDKKGAFAWQGEGTKLIDLKGKTLLPGFVNPHTHVTLIGLLTFATDVSPFKYKTIAEVMDVLREAAKKGPVLALGYDPSLMSDPGQLDFKTLDAISTEVPIVVVNKSGHIAYGNRKAFELARVSDSTPNPVGGSYQRDAEGHLTGLGYEVPAVVRLVSVVNQATPEDYTEMTQAALKILADAGYTTVTDLGLGFPLPTQQDHIETLRKSTEGPNPLVRLQGYVVTNLLDQIPKLQKQNSDWFKVLGLKIWSDGSIQGYTAAMKKDYKGAKTKGALNFSQEQLTQIVMSSRRQGIQVAIHANGDQAVEDTLIAFERAQQAYPSSDPRFRIEHASIVDPKQWKRIAQVKATPSFTEYHVYYWGGVLQDKILGDPRADWLDAAKTAKDLGLKFSFNDDTLGPPAPLLFIQVAASRKTDDGRVLNSKQKITVDDAIKGVTLYPAWQSFREKELGSIEKGKYADFVILSQNPKKADPETIKDIQIVERWLNGKKN
jgi:predicted amidohydrolase YtcJ